jgi:hypothetical protein
LDIVNSREFEVFGDSSKEGFWGASLWWDEVGIGDGGTTEIDTIVDSGGVEEEMIGVEFLKGKLISLNTTWRAI